MHHTKAGLYEFVYSCNCVSFLLQGGYLLHANEYLAPVRTREREKTVQKLADQQKDKVSDKKKMISGVGPHARRERDTQSTLPFFFLLTMNGGIYEVYILEISAKKFCTNKVRAKSSFQISN